MRDAAALSLRLLAASAVLALSTPAQSLDRTSNIEWRTFVVQDFGTNVQYPANIFFPAGRPGKALVSGLRGLTAGLSCPSTLSGMTPAKLPQPIAAQSPDGSFRAGLHPGCKVIFCDLVGARGSNLIQPLQLLTGPKRDSLFRPCVSAGGEALLGCRCDTHQLVLAPA